MSRNEYIKRLHTAYANTMALELPKLKKIKFKASGKYSDSDFQLMQHYCSLAFKELGWCTTYDILNQCFIASTLVHKVLARAHQIDNYLTIGYCTIDGQKYCPTNFKILQSELVMPDKNKGLSAHAWVTLDDGTVIDWAIGAMFDHEDDVVRTIEEGMFYIKPNKNNRVKHIPILLGTDFLNQVGALNFSLKKI